MRQRRAAKKRFPDDDRRSLEAIADEHIHPTQAKKIRNMIGGARYLDGVFGNRHITVNELIGHFIQLEFPRKYPQRVDLELIIERTQKRHQEPERASPRENRSTDLVLSLDSGGSVRGETTEARTWSVFYRNSGMPRPWRIET